MPNQDVLAGVIEKLQAQVTLDASRREEWMRDLKKRNKYLNALRQRLLSESVRLSHHIDALALEWASTGRLPESHQDTALETQLAFLRERIHRAHIFAKWLKDGGCQICGADEENVVLWLLTDFWKLYGQSAWLETIASSA